MPACEPGPTFAQNIESWTMSNDLKSDDLRDCPFHSPASTQDATTPDFAILREHPLNPPEQLKELRQRPGPSKVRLWDGSETWVATHYEDVREILRQSGVQHCDQERAIRSSAPNGKEILINGRPNFTFMDPPEHTKFRRTLARMFTVERFCEERPYVQKSSTGCWTIWSEGTARGVRQQLRARGAGERSGGSCRRTARGPGALSPGGKGSLRSRRPTPSLSLGSGEALWKYLDGLLAEQGAQSRRRRRGHHPSGRGPIVPGKFSRDDAILVINQLLVAGFDTTASTIAIGTLALLENPDQFEKLKVRPLEG